MTRIIFLIAFCAFSLAYFGQRAAVSRQVANVVGVADDRKLLYLRGPELLLSHDEVAHLRAAIGYVNCGNPNAWVTGFLVSHDVVVTVAHVFRTPHGAPAGPVENCFFETQGDKSGTRYFFSNKPGDLVLGSENPHHQVEMLRDFAVGRLTAPVERGRPLPFLSVGRTLREEEGLLPVTAYRADKYMAAGEIRGEPLGQFCSVRRVFPIPWDLSRPTVFYSDCDNTEGGSGSPILQRLRNNRLTVVGMFEGTGTAPDFTPYDGTSEVKSMALSLALDGSFLRAVQSFIYGI